ncbi:MAG: Lrp/AsnC family transcriptional regulator [Natronomonas sp.]
MDTPAADNDRAEHVQDTESDAADDWRTGIDDIDAAIIDGYQSGFPIERRPFDAVADALGIAPEEALRRVRSLHESGLFRRFGAVLNPPVIGASTLAAVRAPEDQFETIAETINGYRQVNHNYRRNHEWNMWFVVTAGSLSRRDEILSEIESQTGCRVLNLPMLTDFYIDLEFPVVNGDRFARESIDSTDVSATRITETAAANLSALDRSILLEIQDGVPLTLTPYADIAAAVGAPVDSVLESITRLKETGCIKRVGCVVNHIATGFDANCMVVWNVPDEQLDAIGETVGQLPYVTLCYHRPRRPELDWEYNLFTMIHGRDPEAVEAKIDELAEAYIPVDHERLHSTATLKQTGARYDEIIGD